MCFGPTIVSARPDVGKNAVFTHPQYRGIFDLGTVTKIGTWLGWQNQFGDIYVTNPPAGKKQNDVAFTTG